MRSRWQEWVITLSVVALGVAGVVILWGDDLRRLIIGERNGEGEHNGERGPAQVAPGPTTPRAPGTAAGPF